MIYKHNKLNIYLSGKNSKSKISCIKICLTDRINSLVKKKLNIISGIINNYGQLNTILNHVNV